YGVKKIEIVAGEQLGAGVPLSRHSQQEVGSPRKCYPVSERATQQEKYASHQDEGHRVFLFMRIEPWRNEQPCLPQQEWHGKKDSGVKGNLDIQVERSLSGQHDQFVLRAVIGHIRSIKRPWYYIAWLYDELVVDKPGSIDRQFGIAVRPVLNFGWDACPDWNESVTSVAVFDLAVGPQEKIERGSIRQFAQLYCIRPIEPGSRHGLGLAHGPPNRYLEE